MNEYKVNEIYSQLFTIRRVEETLLELFSKGFLRGTVHTCIGQEGCAVGVINSIDKNKDLVCSNHRGHGHFIAYCDDIEGLVYEIMGRNEGICGGIGGSQHLHKRGFYSNGILGGMPPVAVGMALAEKLKSTGSISIVFMGDGSMAEGNIYESFNIAALLGVPILFVVEQNQYAQSTHFSMEHAGVLSDRAKPFGINTTIVNGNNVEEVLNASGKIIATIRENYRPQLLFLETYRIAPHSKGDDLRAISEIKMNKLNDPLIQFRNKYDSQIELEKIEFGVNQRIDALINKLQVNL